MSALLALESVGKSYRRGPAQLRVLENASLQVNRGEVVCVLASRGQGKSTLLRLAAGIDGPDSGYVLFEGTDLGCLRDRELSRLLGDRIAWAGRGGPGMAMSMLDYVAMPLLAKGGKHRLLGLLGVSRGGRVSGNGDGVRSGGGAYARAYEALARVGADSCSSQRWDQISDWERSLVELAQAIAPEPALALIDDLTDGLGIRETDELTALVRELSREREMGVLMGVSDGQATLRCDRIVTLAAGRLAEIPTSEPAEVIELPTTGARRPRRERNRR